MVYQYKPRSMIKAPAQVAGEMCERLSQTGGLTPKRLVDANRDVNAPLHNEFEWNDEIAAEAYRESQAAHIIRCIVIKPEVNEETPMRAFVRVTEATSDYTPMKVVMSSEQMMESLLVSARKEMETFVKKYTGVQELNRVIESMNEALYIAG